MLKPEHRLMITRILVLALVIGITVFLFLMRHDLKNIGRYGYPGIFLLSLLSNATLILPMPAVIVTSFMGAIFNPFWVAIAAGSGAALGEITGYMAGFSGQGIMEKTKWHETLYGWINSKYGGIIIMLLAFVPNPFFDIGGMIAGMLKMPLAKFLFWCGVGKILKMMVFAYAGNTILYLSGL